jgi:hypothetical protein
VRYCDRSGVLFRPEVAAFTQTVFNAPPPNSPSVTSVRCFPLFACNSRTKAAVLGVGIAGVQAFFPARKPPRSPKQFSTPHPLPLFDLCGLCAMLSSLRVVLARKPRCPPNSSPRTFFLTEAWEKVPQSLVHSQSTILGSHKASLVSHRGLNVLKRIGGTGQEMGIFKR